MMKIMELDLKHLAVLFHSLAIHAVSLNAEWCIENNYILVKPVVEKTVSHQ